MGSAAEADTSCDGRYLPRSAQPADSGRHLAPAFHSPSVFEDRRSRDRSQDGQVTTHARSIWPKVAFPIRRRAVLEPGVLKAGSSSPRVVPLRDPVFTGSVTADSCLVR